MKEMITKELEQFVNNNSTALSKKIIKIQKEDGNNNR